jgi:beta-glucanase (GH16 family)
MKDCYLFKQEESRGRWVEQTKKKCAETQTYHSQKCTELQDKGEHVCSKVEDKGHQACDDWEKNCCTWWPCSKICESFTWICRGWVWIVNLVCTASTWVAKWACVAWAWVTNVVCVAWVWVTEKIWIASSFVAYTICNTPEWLTNFWLNRQLGVLARLQKRNPKDTPRNPIDKKGWELTFSDDFDAGHVDYDKWSDQAWWGTRYEDDGGIAVGKFPTRYFSPTNFEFTATTIKFIANNIPTTVTDPKYNVTFSIPYSEGRLEWKDPFEQQHGYFEIRCKMPSETEAWPAFWMASTHSWPPEIDVFEYYSFHPHNFESTQHWGTKLSHKKQTIVHPILTAASHFHIYACEWDVNQIKWYYDNQLIRIATNGISEFVHPLHVIVGSGVDTRDNHHPENATYPHFFEVDYVRAYAKI